MGYYFTLPIVVAGLQYYLNVDTGSSDIFIKGQGTVGNPKIKYNCQPCITSNQQFALSYIDGTVQTYEKLLDVSFGGHNYTEHILVAYTAPHNFHAA